MIDTTLMRQRLYEYIRVADEKQLKEMYNMIKEGPTEIEDWWKDEALLNAVKQADAEMEAGRDLGVSWEDLKKDLLARSPTPSIKQKN